MTKEMLAEIRNGLEWHAFGMRLVPDKYIVYYNGSKLLFFRRRKSLRREITPKFSNCGTVINVTGRRNVINKQVLAV